MNIEEYYDEEQQEALVEFYKEFFNLIEREKIEEALEDEFNK